MPIILQDNRQEGAVRRFVCVLGEGELFGMEQTISKCYLFAIG